MEHLENVSIENANLKININLTGLEASVKRAQFLLDSQIMNDMKPYMPMRTGALIQNTSAKSAAYAGTGVVYAGTAPYGRYQYFGKVMVDSQTGRGAFPLTDERGNVVGFRHRTGAKLKPTDRPLTYSRASAQPLWFEVAKKNHGKQWIDIVKKTIGGKHG